MKVVFVSNYINHHQMPFCEEMVKLLGDDFAFVQVSPMEEKRIKMGWGNEAGTLKYVHIMYEEEELCKKLIEDSDIMLLGWIGDDKESTAHKVTTKRLSSGKPVIRISERIYREGRWKMFSPRGLMAKYEEHIKYRKDNVFMLCAGAYVSGDFKALGAYPDKMFKWGYFPPLRTYKDDEKQSMLYKNGEKIEICFAGRLIKLKHPELIIQAGEFLKNSGVNMQIHIAGDGDMRGEIEDLIKKKNLTNEVKMYGAVSPEKVRDIMEKSHIMVFSSNYLEGWGAVVNEAMNSMCAVVASREAGAVPYLINDNENGLTFDKCSGSELSKELLYLCQNPDVIRDMQKNAYDTIADTWNAQIAANRLLSFCTYILKTGSADRYNFPAEGPMSRAKILKPAGFLRSLSEDNHLE